MFIRKVVHFTWINLQIVLNTYYLQNFLLDFSCKKKRKIWKICIGIYALIPPPLCRYAYMYKVKERERMTKNLHMAM